MANSGTMTFQAFNRSPDALPEPSPSTAPTASPTDGDKDSITDLMAGWEEVEALEAAKSVKKAMSLPPKASSARVRRATPPSLPPRPPHNALLSPPTLFLEETLAAHFFFSKLQSIERKCVVEAMRAVPHTPLGSVIVCAGDAWEGFYVIDSGSVKVCIHSKESSSPAVERVLGPGEVFGEESLLYSTPSECTITVGSEETKLWWLSTAQYRHIMATAGANFLRQTFTTLRTMPLFAVFDDARLMKLAQAVKEEVFQGGNVILQKGESGDTMYIIKQGSVRCTDIGHGRPTRDIVLEAGKVFGERALLLDEPRAATVTAVTPTVICYSLSKQTMTLLIGEVSDMLYKSMLVNTLRSIPALSILTPNERVELAHLFVTEGFDDGSVITNDSPCLYVVRDGCARVDPSADGTESDPPEMLCGDYFGEDALLTGTPVLLKVTAVGASRCFILTRTALLSVVSAEDLDVRRRFIAGEIMESPKSPVFPDDLPAVVLPPPIPSASMSPPPMIDSPTLTVFTQLTRTVPLPAERKLSGVEEVASDVSTVSSNSRRGSISKSRPPSTHSSILDGTATPAADSTFLDELLSASVLDTSIAMDELTVGPTLGVGTFGRVILVKHAPTGRVFALKTLKKSKILAMKQQHNVMFERAVMSLGHPFLLKLVQSFQDSKHLYMLTEYVPGGELFSMLADIGRLPISHAQFYTACVVEALSCLHQKMIVYRDIKPENLLIDGQGYIKVVDFGFAKHVPGRTYTMCGTPEYLAPEIIVGNGYTIAVDFWATGILLFEMLYGESPFADLEQNQMVTFKNIIQADLVFPDEVMDSDAVDLITQLLQRDVSLRLGCGVLGDQAIKAHAFFADLGGFDSLLARELPAPWVPALESADDISHFRSNTGGVDGGESGGDGDDEADMGSPLDLGSDSSSSSSDPDIEYDFSWCKGF